MRKKCLALLLAVIMAAALLPTAFAADKASGACGKNLTWTLSGGVLTISGTGEMEMNGSWYDYRDSVKSIVIEDGVTSIDYNAFSQFYSLTSVTIPDSVTSIGHHAFGYCTSLTGVSIPDSVTSIDIGAFYGCESLTDVTIPAGVTSIADRAFGSCGLTGVTIPDGVTSIGAQAFGYCTSLTGVSIPDSVVSIGEGAFLGCESLTSVTIPDSVTRIGEGAFNFCDSLTDVYYGGSDAQWGQILCYGYNYFQKTPWQLDFSNGGQEAAGLEGVEVRCNSVGPDTTGPSKPETPETSFDDVPEGVWYEQAVRYVVENGLMSGTGDSKFSPGVDLDRGMLVTVLARVDGVDTTPESGTPWYRKGMDWAVEHGVSDGTAPERDITREELALMLWRHADRPDGVDTSILGTFPDGSSVDTWSNCQEAVAWAVENGIINGIDGYLKPLGAATRAEAATMIYRYCVNILGGDL